MSYSALVNKSSSADSSLSLLLCSERRLLPGLVHRAWAAPTGRTVCRHGARVAAAADGRPVASPGPGGTGTGHRAGAADGARSAPTRARSVPTRARSALDRAGVAAVPGGSPGRTVAARGSAASVSWAAWSGWWAWLEWWEWWWWWWAGWAESAAWWGPRWSMSRCRSSRYRLKWNA